MDKYEKILKKITREELEEFLLESIMRDLSVKTRFEINFSQYFSSQTKKELKNTFRKALNMVADRGYISEEMGGEATQIVYDCSNKIRAYIEENDINEAIKILEAMLEVIGEYVIDGSYGEHEDIIDESKETIKNILNNASQDEKNKLLTWLGNYIKIEDEFIDYKYEFEELIED